MVAAADRFFQLSELVVVIIIVIMMTPVPTASLTQLAFGQGAIVIPVQPAHDPVHGTLEFLHRDGGASICV